jgi:hypothetical protein
MFLLLIYHVSFGEDLQGYVLRHNWWGVDYYWVHDSNLWGDHGK